MFWKPLIAVDIGSSAIKIVELQGSFTHKRLTAMGLELLPPGAVVAGEIREESMVVDAIKSLLAKLNLQTLGRRVAISMSGTTTSVRKVNIQASAELDFDEQIVNEAEQHLSIDLNDYYLRSQRLTSKMAPEGFIPALIVGAKREAVDQHIRMVKDVGMKAGIVDCDVLCVSNMYEYNYPEIEAGSILLMNVGATKTEVSILSRDGLEFVQDLSIAGEEYTRKICDLIHVDHEQGETLKVSASVPNITGFEDVKNICDQINKQLAQELKSLVQQYIESIDPTSDLGHIQMIYLSGGGARVVGLDACLAEQLNIGVQLTNPFFKINVNPKYFDLEYLSRQSPLYGVAVGLGLRAMKDSVA